MKATPVLVLLHYTRAGYPVGIHTEKGPAFYFPEDKIHARLGEGIVSKRGPSTSWASWCASLASQSQAARAAWVPLLVRGRTLREVLREAQEDSLLGR